MKQRNKVQTNICTYYGKIHILQVMHFYFLFK